MSAYPMDDIIDAESDLRHLRTLIEVTNDMAIGTSLSKAAAPVDHASMNILRDMIWVANDLCGRITKDLEDATGRLVAERRAQRMTGGDRNG